MDKIFTISSRGATPTRVSMKDCLRDYQSLEGGNLRFEKENSKVSEYCYQSLTNHFDGKNGAKETLIHQPLIKILADRTNVMVSEKTPEPTTSNYPSPSKSSAHPLEIPCFLSELKQKMDFLIDRHHYIERSDRSQGQGHLEQANPATSIPTSKAITKEYQSTSQKQSQAGQLPDLESYFGTYDLDYGTNDLNKFVYKPSNPDDQNADIRHQTDKLQTEIWRRWEILEDLVRSMASQLQTAHERNGELLLEIQSLNDRSKDLAKLLQVPNNHKRVLSSGSNFSLVNLSEDLHKEFREEFKGRLPHETKLTDLLDPSRPSDLQVVTERRTKHMHKSSVPSILISPTKDVVDSSQQQLAGVFQGYNFTESVSHSPDKVEPEESRARQRILDGESSHESKLPVMEFESNMQQLHFNSTEDEGMAGARDTPGLFDRHRESRYIGWTMEQVDGEYDENVIPECVTIENRPSTELHSKFTAGGVSQNDIGNLNSRRSYKKENGYRSVDFNFNQGEYFSEKCADLRSMCGASNQGLIQGFALRAESIGEQECEPADRDSGRNLKHDMFASGEEGISIKGFESGVLKEFKVDEHGRLPDLSERRWFSSSVQRAQQKNLSENPDSTVAPEPRAADPRVNQEGLSDSEKDIFIKLLMEELETLRNRLAEFEGLAGKPDSGSIIVEASPEEESSKLSIAGRKITEKDVNSNSPGELCPGQEPILVRKKTLKEIFATSSSMSNPDDKKDLIAGQVLEQNPQHPQEHSQMCPDSTRLAENQRQTEGNQSAANQALATPTCAEPQSSSNLSKQEISQLLRLNLSKLKGERRERSAVRESADRPVAEPQSATSCMLRLPRIGMMTQGTLGYPEDLDGSNPYGLGETETVGTIGNHGSSRRSSRDAGSSSRRSSKEYGRYQRKLKTKPGQTERSGGSKDPQLKQTSTSLLKKSTPGIHRGSLQLSSTPAHWESIGGASGFQRSQTQQDENSTQLSSSVRFTAPDGFCLVDPTDTNSIEISRGIGLQQNIPENQPEVAESNSVSCEANLLKNFDTFDRGAEQQQLLDSCRDMKKIDTGAEMRFFTLQKQADDDQVPNCHGDHRNLEFDIQIQDDHDYIHPTGPEPLISFRQDLYQNPAPESAEIHPFLDTLSDPLHQPNHNHTADRAVHHATSLEHTASFAGGALSAAHFCTHPHPDQSTALHPSHRYTVNTQQHEQRPPAGLPPPDQHHRHQQQHDQQQRTGLSTHATDRRLLQTLSALHEARCAGESAVLSLSAELQTAALRADPTVQRWIFTVVKARGQSVWQALLAEEDVTVQRIVRELEDLIRKYCGVGEKILSEQVGMLKEWATWGQVPDHSDLEDRKTGYLTPAPGTLTPIERNSSDYNRDTLRELDV